MTTFRAFAVVLVIFAAASRLPAQKVGSTSMQFLHVMPGARATAMGDAYSVLAWGAEATHWNPSGVALTHGNEFSGTYTSWLFDSKLGSLSYAGSLGDAGAIGVQLLYVDFGEFEQTDFGASANPDLPYLTGNTFHPFSYLIGASYARNLTDRFAVGVSLKYAHESLFNGQTYMAMTQNNTFEEVNTWGNALLFDLGIRYNTGYRSVQIAAVVQNFGKDVKYAKESSPVPLLFRFGIAGDLIGNDALLMNDDGQRLTVAFDLFQPNDYAQQEHIGVEYEFAGAFALRAGYKFNYDYENVTLGAGVKQSFGSTKFSLDYSYGTLGTYLGSAQRITLGVSL